MKHDERKRIFLKCIKKLTENIVSIKEVGLAQQYRQQIVSQSIDYFIRGGHYNYNLTLHIDENEMWVDFIEIHDDEERSILDISMECDENKLNVLLDIVIETVKSF